METRTYGRFDNTGVVVNYERNISNDVANPAATITTTGTFTPDVFPMINDGTNTFEYAIIEQTYEKLDFDPTFNGGLGGIICNRLKNDTEFFTRITITNSAGTASVIFQNFLVFDKTIPGTGIAINSSTQSIAASSEGAFSTKFFSNGIEAVYPRIATNVSRSVLCRGFDITASENQ